PRLFFFGWRGLARFWLLIAGLLAVSGVVLGLLGEPPGPAPHSAVRSAPAQLAAEPVRSMAKPAPAGAEGSMRAGRSTPGPIADPDPALQETVAGTSGSLPRIGSDGRTPMQVYAAGFDRSSRRPKVGIVLAGIGLIQAESEEAIRALPHGVT